MPVYDYRCGDCGKVSEIFQRSLDSQAIKCPNCGSENLEKLVSASYMIKMSALAPGLTCCGRTERCETPPCASGGSCRRR
jgi:putative FmdB family regulatory protein